MITTRRYSIRRFGHYIQQTFGDIILYKWESRRRATEQLLQNEHTCVVTTIRGVSYIKYNVQNLCVAIPLEIYIVRGNEFRGENGRYILVRKYDDNKYLRPYSFYFFPPVKVRAS